MKQMLIKGTGRYLPSRLVTNDDLSKWMDTSDEWIRQRTGIETRHWIPEGEKTGTSDLALEAAHIALNRAGWTPQDIDLIIFATLSPDLFFPGAGCLLQHKLGLETTPALDIRQQCTGFIYGLTTADAYIKAGYANKILFIGAEIQSAALDISTRGRHVSVIFGDGAGALCLEGVETGESIGVLGSALHAQGEFARNLMIEVPTFACNRHITEEMIQEGRHFTVMDGRTVFKHAVTRLPQVTNEVLEKAGLELNDVDLFIPHQANLRINQAIQKALDLPDEKIFNNIQRYGNTTAASIPIALDEALEMNLIAKGSTVCFLALGAGFTWGGLIYKF